MKISVKIILVACVIKSMLMMFSCTDHRLDGMVDDKVYLLNYDLQNINVFNFGEFTSNVTICKGGIGSIEADVELDLDPEIVIRYNNLNGTSYRLLPSQCYELSANSFKFDSKDIRKIMVIKYHTNAIANLTDRNNYVIPLRMTVGEGIPFDENKQTLLVHPTFIEPYIFLLKSGSQVEIPIRASGDITSASFEIGINYPNLIDPFAWDITFELEPDPSLLANYNASTGKNYQMLSPDAYSLGNNEWSIAKSKTLKDIPIQLFKKRLADNSGDYKFGDYALPVKISKVSKWGIEAERNNLLMLVPFYPAAFDAIEWKILDWNSAITMDEGQESSTKTPYGLLAGTGWESKKTAPLPPLPYYFLIDMLSQKTITQINIHFGATTVNLREGYYEISSDNINWTKIADWVHGTVTNPADRVNRCPIPAENQVKSRYLRFVISRAINNFVPADPDQGARMDVERLEVIGFE